MSSAEILGSPRQAQAYPATSHISNCLFNHTNSPIYRVSIVMLQCVLQWSKQATCAV